MTIEIPPDQQTWLREIDPRKSYRQAHLLTNANRYAEGDTVSTPQGVGVVLEAITEGTVDGKDASNDSPVYAVAVEDERVGTGFYRASEIHATTIDIKVENPAEDIEANASLLDALFPNRDTTFNYPQSWVKSDTPARIILLKAWAELGSFEEARQELGSKRLAASMKDRVVGSEKWRGGWTD